jgi:hypothetical protein
MFTHAALAMPSPLPLVLDADALAALRQARPGTRLLDVRTPGEFEAEHIARAFNIPLDTFVGSGLVFAGMTDTCAMGMLIAKLPHNRSAVSDVSATVLSLVGGVAPSAQRTTRGTKTSSAA